MKAARRARRSKLSPGSRGPRGPLRSAGGRYRAGTPRGRSGPSCWPTARRARMSSTVTLVRARHSFAWQPRERQTGTRPPRLGTDDRGTSLMRCRIVGYRRDDEGHWVAELDCGHRQHVRHQPPWMERTWVTTPEGLCGRLGTELDCHRCDEEGTPVR